MGLCARIGEANAALDEAEEHARRSALPPVKLGKHTSPSHQTNVNA
jgi:hypothetical protein